MRFWFHYHKPASASRGCPTLSLHFRNKCHLIDNIQVCVPVAGRIRKQQPRFVLAGKANRILIENGVARIT
jgi:hypothetical protein